MTKKIAHIIMGTSMFSSASWKQEAFKVKNKFDPISGYQKWLEDDRINAPEARTTMCDGQQSGYAVKDAVWNRLSVNKKDNHEDIAQYFDLGGCKDHPLRYCAEMSTLIVLWKKENRNQSFGEYLNNTYERIYISYIGSLNLSKAYHCAAQFKAQLAFIMYPSVNMVQLSSEEKLGMNMLEDSFSVLVNSIRDNNVNQLVLSGGYKILVAMAMAALIDTEINRNNFEVVYLNEEASAPLIFTKDKFANELNLVDRVDSTSAEPDLM